MKPSASAIFTSLILAAVFTIIIYLLSYLNNINKEIPEYLLYFLIIFIVTGFFIRLLYKRFITDQLKQIYHGIFRLRYPNLKSIPEVKDNLLPERINEILIEWNTEAREEIDHLRQVENYRRDFLSNVSHELKTPVFTIQGYIHTLIDGGIEDPEINMLYLSKAGKSIERLISIIDDLESISKLEAGELIVEPRTFDITELVRDTIESLELKAKDKSIRFIISESSLKPAYVYADKEMIRQVLTNLLVNSIKYGKEHGSTEILISDEEPMIAVAVKDDGIGIEKAHLPRLFERFYRVDKSRSREQGGTGLGLAIVKHILEAHDSSISVKSDFGKGTVFTFRLRKSK